MPQYDLPCAPMQNRSFRVCLARHLVGPTGLAPLRARAYANCQTFLGAHLGKRVHVEPCMRASPILRDALHELQISRLDRRSAHEDQGLGCGVRCFYVRLSTARRSKHKVRVAPDSPIDRRCTSDVGLEQLAIQPLECPDLARQEEAVSVHAGFFLLQGDCRALTGRHSSVRSCRLALRLVSGAGKHAQARLGTLLVLVSLKTMDITRDEHMFYPVHPRPAPCDATVPVIRRPYERLVCLAEVVAARGFTAMRTINLGRGRGRRWEARRRSTVAVGRVCLGGQTNCDRFG
jgi:hypothetical protein